MLNTLKIFFEITLNIFRAAPNAGLHLAGDPGDLAAGAAGLLQAGGQAALPALEEATLLLTSCCNECVREVF